MKKHIILFAVAALTMSAACTKVDVETPDQKISFEVANYVAQTKAEGSLATEGFYNFHTYANFFPEIGDAQAFMTNVQINPYNNSNVLQTSGNDIYSWAPAVDYYWPKTGYINFYSYAGTKNPSVSMSDDKKTATFSYTNQEIASTDNILVADAALHFNENNHSVYNQDHVTAGVPTLFRHQLAQVAFKVHLKTTDAKKSANTEWTVQVLADNANSRESSVTVVKTGSLVLTNADALAADATKNSTKQEWTISTGDATNKIWTPASATEEIKFTTQTLTIPINATESDDTKDLVAMRTVLPQAAGGVNIKLYYQVSATHTGESTPFMTEIISVNATLTTLAATPAYWKINQQITYTINIDPVTQKVTFDPAVAEWESQTGTINYPIVP